MDGRKLFFRVKTKTRILAMFLVLLLKSNKFCDCINCAILPDELVKCFQFFFQFRGFIQIVSFCGFFYIKWTFH